MDEKPTATSYDIYPQRLNPWKFYLREAFWSSVGAGVAYLIASVLIPIAAGIITLSHLYPCKLPSSSDPCTNWAYVAQACIVIVGATMNISALSGRYHVKRNSWLALLGGTVGLLVGYLLQSILDHQIGQLFDTLHRSNISPLLYLLVTQAVVLLPIFLTTGFGAAAGYNLRAEMNTTRTKTIGLCLLFTMIVIGIGGGAMPLLPTSVDAQGHHSSLHAAQPTLDDPFEPAVELTVCPQGPPVCQFSKIQAAIDAAPTTDLFYSWEKKPKIPLIDVAAGTYTENLTILKSIWLRGVGRDQVILRAAQKQATISIASVRAILDAGIGVGIEGFTIEDWVQVMGVVSGVIRQNNLRPGVGESGGLGIIGAHSNLIVEGNTITQGFNGITILSVGLLNPDGGQGIYQSFGSVIIRDNEIMESAHGAGISLRYASDVIIRRNHIQKNLIGIHLLNSRAVQIAGNTITDNGGAISDLWSTSVAIYDNRVERQSGDSIHLTGGLYNIEKNQIINNGGRGLTLETGSAPFFNARLTALKANLITNNGRGLEADKDTTILLCAGNQISGNKQGDYETTEELRKQCEGK